MNLHINSDYVIAGILFAAAVFLTGLLLERPRNLRWYRRKYGSSPSDAAFQLNAIMSASFKKRRLLSAAEYRIFNIVEKCVMAQRKGYRVFAQTSLGEILQSPDDEAFRAINSKRVDVLIVDPGGWPLLAIEHQGAGHYQGNSAARDAIKKEALRRAGVPYLEVFDSNNEEQIRYRICEQFHWNAAVDTAENSSRSGTAPLEPAASVQIVH